LDQKLRTFDLHSCFYGQYIGRFWNHTQKEDLMKKTVLQLAVVSLITGLALPAVSGAAEDDLQQKMNALTKEVQELRNAVKKTEEKSLSKWLTISGDYRFRVDSMHGKTVAYTDVNKTFTNAQNALQGAFFADPTGTSPYFGPASNAAALSAFSQFAQNMQSVRTYQQAVNFPAGTSGGFPNSSLMGGMAAFAANVPAFKPKNETLYTNKFGLNLTAKATEDVTVHARLLMYKSFGSENDSQVTGNYFADRVGVFDGTLSHVPSSSRSGSLPVVVRPHTALLAICVQIQSVPEPVVYRQFLLIMPLTVSLSAMPLTLKRFPALMQKYATVAVLTAASRPLPTLSRIPI
jgi:hypothetical protein